jgi:7-cyano-7-deazaguanine synthase
VAAARSAADHDLILLHVDYGQASARTEFQAVEALSEIFPSGRVIGIGLAQQPRPDGKPSRVTGSGSSRGPAGEGAGGSPGAGVRALMPVLVSAGVQSALRMGASQVVLGLSRFCDAEHLGLTGDGTPGTGRREFVHAFNLMLESLPTPGPNVRVEAPLMDVRFPEIVKLAGRLGVPVERTWTCERPGPRPCGRCRPCASRASAFVAAALVDPLSEQKRTAHQPA